MTRTTKRDRHPLIVLADVAASDREIFVLARDKARILRSKLLRDNCPTRRAQHWVRTHVESWLATRAFSRYGKKRLLDRVVADVMRHYRDNLCANYRSHLEMLRLHKIDGSGSIEDIMARREAEALGRKLADEGHEGPRRASSRRGRY